MSEREKRLVDACGEYASIAKLASSSGVPATRLYEMSRNGAPDKARPKVSVRAFARLLDAIDDGVASRSGDMVASGAHTRPLITASPLCYLRSRVRRPPTRPSQCRKGFEDTLTTNCTTEETK